MPAPGLTAYVNATTKVWAQNVTMQLPTPTTGMLTTLGDGVEYDVVNDNGFKAASDYVKPVGIQLVQLGNATASDGMIVRGVWQRGVNVEGAVDAGYIFNPSAQGLNARLSGFLSRQASGNAFGVLPAGITNYT